MTQRSKVLVAPDLKSVQWQWSAFESLTVAALHAALRLRAAVFVVEQNCVYPDIDGLDLQSWHLLGWSDGTRGQLAAYLRVVPPGVRFAEPSIGRVVVDPRWRGRQLGRDLMGEGITHLMRQYPASPIRISAQQHLSRFYEPLGFEICSPPYREDDIPHVQMLRAAEP